jgi:Ca2+-binding EF-hand superfamily protein
MSDSSDSERFSEGWDEHARKAFILLDPKEDKFILGAQLEYYFQVVGENPTRGELLAAITAVGKKVDDQFTFDDCVAALKSFVSSTISNKNALSAADVVRIVTQNLDPNGTGTFTKDALIKLMTGDGSNDASMELLSKEEMEQILAELKITDGNTIQAADFFSLLLDI